MNNIQKLLLVLLFVVILSKLNVFEKMSVELPVKKPSKKRSKKPSKKWYEWFKKRSKKPSNKRSKKRSTKLSSGKNIRAENEKLKKYLSESAVRISDQDP